MYDEIHYLARVNIDDNILQHADHLPVIGHYLLARETAGERLCHKKTDVLLIYKCVQNPSIAAEMILFQDLCRHPDIVGRDGLAICMTGEF